MEQAEFMELVRNSDVKNDTPEGYIRRGEAIMRYHSREQDDDDICGFYFNLEILEDFITKIKNYNIRYTGSPCRQVSGIRIWQAGSDAFSSGRLTEDVVITPTVSDNGSNSDIHAFLEGEDLTDGAGNLLILSSSRPCPNLCGTPGCAKFFYTQRITPTQRICAE